MGYFVFEILYGDRFVFLFFIYILELDILGILKIMYIYVNNLYICYMLMWFYNVCILILNIIKYKCCVV